MGGSVQLGPRRAGGQTRPRPAATMRCPAVRARARAQAAYYGGRREGGAAIAEGGGGAAPNPDDPHSPLPTSGGSRRLVRALAGG